MSSRMTFPAFVCCLLLVVAFGCAAPAVRGTIRYQGERIDRVDPREPVFSFKNAPVTYRSGQFLIEKLEPGVHAMAITINADKGPSVFAGDYYTWFEFGAVKDVTAVLDVNINRIIHLRQPMDNAARVRETDAECMDLPRYPDPLTLAWDTLGPDVYYDYEVVRVLCPFKQVQVAAYGTTTDTSLVLSLDASKDKEFYLLRLHARKNGWPVGTLMIESPKGATAWDIRFRIEK
jgi:hypothetical protein